MKVATEIRVSLPPKTVETSSDWGTLDRRKEEKLETIGPLEGKCKETIPRRRECQNVGKHRRVFGLANGSPYLA